MCTSFAGLSSASRGAPSTAADALVPWRRALIFLRRAAEAYDHAGRDNWLDHAPAGSYAHLALLIGGARSLPPALSDKFATAFCETWGEWSRDMRLGGAL